MKDTPEAVEEMHRAMLMKLSPAERLAMACHMFDTAKALALAGIRSRQKPDDTLNTRQKLFLHFYRKISLLRKSSGFSATLGDAAGWLVPIESKLSSIS